MEHKCQICEKVFRNKQTLQKHTKNIHEKMEVLKCNICNISFQNKYGLLSHTKTFHEQKKNDCRSCGKSFSTTQNLNKHIYKVHEGQRDHKCESCGKSFSEAGTLNRHIHTVQATKIINVNLLANHFLKHKL